MRPKRLEALGQLCERVLADRLVSHGQRRASRGWQAQSGASALVEKPDGDLMFLERNPHGQFGLLEETVGLSIFDGIAEALTRITGRQRDARAPTSEKMVICLDALAARVPS